MYEGRGSICYNGLFYSLGEHGRFVGLFWLPFSSPSPRYPSHVTREEEPPPAPPHLLAQTKRNALTPPSASLPSRRRPTRLRARSLCT